MGIFAKFGLVQNWRFWGNGFERFCGPSAMMDLADMVEVGYDGLVTAESVEPKQFQPMGMDLAGQ